MFTVEEMKADAEAAITLQVHPGKGGKKARMMGKELGTRRGGRGRGGGGGGGGGDLITSSV